MTDEQHAKRQLTLGDRIWISAKALAIHRHPNASYPQPRDEEDASIVVRALNAWEKSDEN